MVIGVRILAGQGTSLFSKASRDLWVPWENSCLFKTSIHALGSIVEFSLLQDTWTHSGLHRKIFSSPKTSRPTLGYIEEFSLLQDTQIHSGLHRRIYLLHDTETHSGLHGRTVSSPRHPEPLWVTSKNFLFSKTPGHTLGYIEAFSLLQDTQIHSGLHRRIFSFPKPSYPLWVLLILMLSDTTASFAGSNWPWYHSFPFIVVAKHDLNCTSTIPYAFMVWCCMMCRDILNFVL